VSGTLTTMKWSCVLFRVALTSWSSCLFSQVVYVTNSTSGNISAYTVNAGSGALVAVPGSPFPAGIGPSQAAIDPTGKFLYVTNVPPFLGPPGPSAISAFTISAGSGALTAVPGSPFPTVSGPVGMAVDPTGKFLYVANHGSDSAPSSDISAYTINAASGALNAIQGSPFPTPSGPEGTAVDPTGKFLYVAGPSSSGVAVYSINAGSGALTSIPGSPFPAGPVPTAVAVHPTGKFVYVLSVDLYVYSAATGSGALTAIQGSPFHTEGVTEALAIDPGGKYVFVGNSFPSSVSVYSVNPDSGALTKVQGSPFQSGQGLSGLAVDPAGKFLYTVNSFPVFALYPFGVSAYAINATTGALTEIPGSPFQAAMGSTGIAIHSLPAAPPLPTVTSLAPSSATAGSPAFTLTITGTGFLSGATAQWDGTPLSTTFLSATQLTAAVPASLIVTAGSASVTVSNPGAMASRAAAFTINPVVISISANGVVNGASQVGGAVSAGEIVIISGSNFGPGAFTGDQLDSNGYVTTSLAGVQALFDGVAAPLLSAQAGQVTAVVPYEVSGNPSTQLQISYQGQASSAVTVPVAVAAPGIFTADSSGSGQGLISNEDGAANAPGNAASAGSTVVVYATGEGQTIPGGVDGKPGDSATPPVPVQTVTATVGGLDALVVAAGGISGMAAGYMQVSVQIPQNVTVGDSVPIILKYRRN
jgi:6-phosphogluconolactonase